MSPTVRLRLYVCGKSLRSERALQKLRGLGLVDAASGVDIEVIDVLLRPDLAEIDGVIATPTLIRIQPKPEVRVVGDLDGRQLVAETLGLSAGTAEGKSITESDNG